jgi:hypothetical protein
MVSSRVVAGAPVKEYVGRRADEEGVISIGAPSDGQPTAGSNRAGSTSASLWTARPTVGSTG